MSRTRGSRSKAVLTARQKRALIKDERMATREYKHLGFMHLSNQEASHAKFIAKQPVKGR